MIEHDRAAEIVEEVIRSRDGRYEPWTIEEMTLIERVVTCQSDEIINLDQDQARKYMSGGVEDIMNA